MPPRPPGITQPPWASMFPAQVVAIVSAIVGGAPFARSLTPLPTNRASVSFPQLDPEDPEWVAELGVIPLLTPDTERVRGGGIQAGRVDPDQPGEHRGHRFPGHPADRADPPRHVSAPSSTATSSAAPGRTRSRPASWPWPPRSPAIDWYDAAIKAKAEIATAGGEASHVAFSPAVIGELEGTRDEIGHPLFPDAGTHSPGWRRSRRRVRDPAGCLRRVAGCGWRSAAISRLISPGGIRGVEPVRESCGSSAGSRWPRRCRAAASASSR